MLLFFDFDGTLADSSPGIYASFELACSRLNLTAPLFHEFCEAIGPPVQRIAHRFFPDLTDSEIEEFRQIFRDDYDNERFRLFNWYEGVKPTIKALAALPSCRLTIVTNKPTGPTLELLRMGGLSAFFDLVVGIDYQMHHGIGPAFRTKAEAIKLAHARLGKGEVPSIYIGDTPSDRDASQACGLEFIAATYGFHRWHDSELSASFSISAISGLIPLLQAKSSARLQSRHDRGVRP
jgi:phosphoglycolate phosphatase